MSQKILLCLLICLLLLSFVYFAYETKFIKDNQKINKRNIEDEYQKVNVILVVQHQNSIPIETKSNSKILKKNKIEEPRPEIVESKLNKSTVERKKDFLDMSLRNISKKSSNSMFPLYANNFIY